MRYSTEFNNKRKNEKNIHPCLYYVYQDYPLTVQQKRAATLVDEIHSITGGTWSHTLRKQSRYSLVNKPPDQQ
ncbi:MAG: hypothetical protein HQK53_17455 [Oligoflexia bacterium]|nr:hypothetical protein [Oligoflexia bacterium]